MILAEAPIPTESRTHPEADPEALEAWRAAGLRLANDVEPTVAFDVEAFTLAAVRGLVKLSVHADGPRRVRQALAEMGVILVVLPHPPGAPLDGAAMRRGDGAPVIALTLRHDRIDAFWFALVHELAHVVFHLEGEASVFLDDLDIPGIGEREELADRLARQALVPDDIWAALAAAPDAGLGDILDCARRAEVSPALVAGRWRSEHRGAGSFAELLGTGTIADQLAPPP